MKDKLKTQACWICGKKLWGGKFTIAHIDGYDRKCHKICIKLSKTTEDCSLHDSVFENINNCINCDEYGYKTGGQDEG